MDKWILVRHIYLPVEVTAALFWTFLNDGVPLVPEIIQMNNTLFRNSRLLFIKYKLGAGRVLTEPAPFLLYYPFS